MVVVSYSMQRIDKVTQKELWYEKVMTSIINATKSGDILSRGNSEKKPLAILKSFKISSKLEKSTELLNSPPSWIQSKNKEMNEA